MSNDDFNSLLEWIDYNFEAYLALKEKEGLELRKGDFLQSDKKYQRLIENSDYIQKEQQSIISFLNDYIKDLDQYKEKIEELKRMKESNRNLSYKDQEVQQLFKKV